MIGVVGAGAIGKALAALLSSDNTPVVLCDTDEYIINQIATDGITSTGALETWASIPATTRFEELAEQCSALVIATPAWAHASLTTEIEAGVNASVIAYAGGSWGAYQLVSGLGGPKAVRHRKLTVLESSATPVTASSSGLTNVHIKAIRPTLSVACCGDYFALPDQIKLGSSNVVVEKADSIIATSLASVNPVVHTPIVATNLAQIEKRSPFRFYADGMTSFSLELMKQVDRDRLAAGAALGLTLPSAHAALGASWSMDYSSLEEALLSNDSYMQVPGPSSTSHRYITEDVGFGLAPISSLCRQFGIDGNGSSNLLDFFSNGGLLGPQLNLETSKVTAITNEGADK